MVLTAGGPTARGVIVLEVLLASVGGVQVLAGRATLSGLITHIGHGPGLASVAGPGLLLVAVSAFAVVAGVVAGQRRRLLADKVSRAAWDVLLDAGVVAPLSDFEHPGFYDHLERVRHNALQRPVQMTFSLVGAVGGAIGAASLVVVVGLLDPVMIPIVALAALPLALTQRRSARIDFGFVVDQTPASRERWYVREALLDRIAAKEIRAFDAGPLLRERYERSYDRFISDAAALVRRQTVIGLFGIAMAGLVGLGALGVLAFQLDTGSLGVASAGAVLVSVQMLAGRMQQLAGSAGGIFENSLYLADLDAFAAARAPGSDCPRPPAPAGFPGLSAEKLCYTYPATDAEVLHDIDLTLRPGEVVALVGENGSGKSTLAKVISGLLEPTSGRLLWGGVDVSGYDPASLRRNVAVVFQDFYRYQLPAALNIGLGRAEAAGDRDRIARAATAAEADGIISGLPDGYDTYLSREFAGGRDLSGGEWQRIALARAFFRDAPLVVLDEPSAALDPIAEQSLFERIRELLAGRSVVLISHRFSTVRSADRIVVLARGRIVEQGSHDELIAAEGVYSEMFRIQAAGYQTDPTPR
jgi:ATP-binding cassette subfamily B protein